MSNDEKFDLILLVSISVASGICFGMWQGSVAAGSFMAIVTVGLWRLK